MMSKILIVEDEPDIVELLAYNLHQAGLRRQRYPMAKTPSDM